MDTLELVVWSAAAGAIGLVVLFCLMDFALSRSSAAAQGVAYNLAALVFVLVQSGVINALVPALDESQLRTLQVLSGPLCACLGNYWIRGYLATRHRDRLMDATLLGSAILVPVAGLLALFLPASQQLPASALAVGLSTCLVIGICMRASMLGDAMALGIAAGSAIMLVALAGLYGVALRLPGFGPGMQAVTALLSVLSIALIGWMMWKRTLHARQLNAPVAADVGHDPVTHLPFGAAFVRRLIRALERRRISRRDGAMLAVIVFNAEAIATQVGPAGLNEVYLNLARRLQQQVGVVNQVGRYWDKCFVALVESIHSPAALRTMGLRVASSLRRPFYVRDAERGRAQVRAEIGLGIVHLGREPAQVEDMLHEAQRLAGAARKVPSRAAIFDPQTGQAVAVEDAELGPRRLRAGAAPSAFAGHARTR